MAEPARNLPEEDQPDIRPRFGVVQGGGEGDGRPTGDLQSVAGSPEDYSDTDGVDASNLSARERANDRWGMSDNTSASSESSFYHPEGESSASTATSNQLSTAEVAGAGAAAGFGFSLEKANPWSRMTDWIGRNKGKSATGGGIIGLLIGGGFFLGGIATGPMQLINLAHILDHSFSKVQSDSSDRTNHLFRYAKALQEKNVGYTRVGLIGQKVMGGVLADLGKVGITIETNKANRPTGIKFEKSKLEKEFPETKNMHPDEYKSFVADKLGVPVEELTGNIDNLHLDVKNYKFSATKNLIKNGQIGLVGDGKIEAGLKTRVLGKFFGLGSLFHPFSKALAQKLNDRVNAATEKRQSKQEAEQQFAEEQTRTQTGGVDSEGATVASKVEEDVKGQSGIRTKGIIVAGVVLAGACIAHEAASEIPKIDYYRVVAPTEIEATSIIAMGSQAMDGSGGITADQVGAKIESFTDKNGNTIWQSAGINALEGNKLSTTSKGAYQNDIPISYRQAYGSHMTANTINSIALNILDGITGPGELLKFFGVSHPGAALCNSAVQWTLFGLSTIAQGIADFFSGGAAQVAITGAETAETVAVQTLVIGNVIKMAEDWFVNSKTAGKLAEDAFSGPLGGNLLAYGSRAAADVAAIGGGGISMGNSSSTFVSAADKADEQQFENQSLYAKVFDTGDYRSLTSRMAMSLNAGFMANVSSLGNSMLHLGSSLSSVFGSLMPGASADTTNNSWSGNYNWGFPQYGIPDDMLNDPNLADPYTNANDVGKHLSSVCQEKGSDGTVKIGPSYGDCASHGPGGDGIAGRIMACFGNTLTYDSSTKDGTWDVVPAKDVDLNPNSDSYTEHNCGDTSDSFWRRAIMWVNDTSTMKSIACYTGDDQQSCSDIGLTGTSTTDQSSSTAGTGSNVSGNSTALAKEVLSSPNITLQKDCITGPTQTPSGCAYQDILAASQGQKVTPGKIEGQSNGTDASTGACSARTPVYLDATMLQAMLNLAAKYKYTVQDIDSGHDCDTGLHPKGKAFDVYAVNDTSVSGSCSSSTIQDFRKYAANVLAQLVPNQSGNNMPGVSQCGGDATLPSGVRTFFDASDQVHIDVGYSSSV